MSKIRVPVNTCNVGRTNWTLLIALDETSTHFRTVTLDIATILVSIAVPRPITKTANAPASKISICQVMTKRKIAPVHGRMAMLSTRTNASLKDFTLAASCAVGP